jgi:hypothetical protein
MNVSCIIDLINQSIVAKYPQQNVKAFGLTEFYYDSLGKFYPGIVNNQGEVRNVFLEDQYQTSWYHRTQAGTFAIADKQFGDKTDSYVGTIPVSLIIFHNRQKANQSLENIKDILIAALPTNIERPECERLGFQWARVELTSYELDTFKVFRQECSVEEVKVGFERGLIEIRYNIIVKFRASCVKLCS